MDKNLDVREKEGTDQKKKKDKKKRVLVLGLAALVGIAGVGGLVGTSAFFTDSDHADGSVNVGTLDMQLDDLSDLDGNYRTWTTRLSSTSKLIKNGQQADTWNGNTAGAGTAVKKLTDSDAPIKTDDEEPGTGANHGVRTDSIGIVNPGDTGILAFKVSNIAEKSMDTAAVITVEVELPEGAYDDTTRAGKKIIAYDSTGTSLTTAPAVEGASSTYNVENAKEAVDTSTNQKALALLADTTTDQGKADAGAYTIEGLGTPVVYQGRFQRDSRGEYTDHLIDTDKNVITLRYYTTLETLKGTVENTTTKYDGTGDTVTLMGDDTHDAGDSAIYAYNVDFDRAVTNKFQNATIMVDCAVYAKQHRDGYVSATDFDTVDGTNASFQGVEAAASTGTNVPRTESATGGKQVAQVINSVSVVKESQINTAGTLEASKDSEGRSTGNETVEEFAKAVHNRNGQSGVRSNINQTHVISAQEPIIDLASDWSMIGSFSHVINGSTTNTGVTGAGSSYVGTTNERPSTLTGIDAATQMTPPDANTIESAIPQVNP